MSKEDIENKEEKELNEETVQEEQTEETSAEETQEETQEEAQEEELDEVSKVTAELAEMKDKYLRLYSEFENFRKRTQKEKSDLLVTASERVIVDLLGIVDDFERGMKANEDTEDIAAVKEGIALVYDKFAKLLKNKGVEPINATGEEFDTELHEAITQIPSPTEDMKGKVIDEVEKGYKLGEKVIRYSKVVVGA